MMACRNCDTPLQGPYCHTCGQENRDLDAPFRDLLSEWLGNFFAFDARAWRTLLPLITKPGFVTEEYRSGRRVRYVPPLRLYFFISVLMFLVLAWTQQDLVRVSEKGTSDGVITIFETPSEQEPAKEEDTVDPKEDDLGRLVQERLVDDPKGFNQDFLAHLPKGLFFMVPLFALLLWIFFRSSERLYLYHVVFSLHFHAFVFLVLAIGAAGDAALGMQENGLGDAVGAPIVLIYFFMALRRFYGQSRLRTAWKMVLVMMLYLFVFLAAMLGIIALILYAT